MNTLSPDPHLKVLKSFQDEFLSSLKAEMAILKMAWALFNKQILHSTLN